MPSCLPYQFPASSSFNLKSFITILTHLSHVFISILIYSTCLHTACTLTHSSPVFIYTLTSDLACSSCLHMYLDTLKPCLIISTLTHSSHVFVYLDTFKSYLLHYPDILKVRLHIYPYTLKACVFITTLAH